MSHPRMITFSGFLWILGFLGLTRSQEPSGIILSCWECLYQSSGCTYSVRKLEGTRLFPDLVATLTYKLGNRLSHLSAFLCWNKPHNLFLGGLKGMLDGHPSLERLIFHSTFLGMLQTKWCHILIILKLSFRIIIHQLSGKFSPSSKDMQAITQARLGISLQGSICSALHSNRSLVKRKEYRVRWETPQDLVLCRSHLVCPYLSRSEYDTKILISSNL